MGNRRNTITPSSAPVNGSSPTPAGGGGFEEKGTPGLEVWGGYIQQAYTAELYWPSVYPLYNRMRRSDPEMRMVMQGFQTFTRGVSFTWEPDGENPSDDDKKAADFANEIFDDLEGGDGRLINQIVSYVPFMGFGWWEIVPGRREKNWRFKDDPWRSQYNDGAVGIRRFGWRDHSSFHRWDIDAATGRLGGMWQMDTPNPEVLLPLADSLHLTFGDDGANPEGLSPLEAIYRLEYIKRNLEIVMGIGFEHAAGHLSVNTEGTPTPQEKTAIRNAAKAILTAKAGNYAMWPGGIDGKVEDVPFQAAADILEATRYYGLLKLTLFQSQWVAIATIADTGAYAALQDMTSMYLLSLNSMLKGYTSQASDQLGSWIFDRMNAGRFPGMTRKPKLVASKVEKSIKLDELATFVTSVFPMMPVGEADWLSVRERSGFLEVAIPDDAEMLDPMTDEGNDGDPAPAGNAPADEPEIEEDDDADLALLWPDGELAPAGLEAYNTIPEEILEKYEKAWDDHLGVGPEFAYGSDLIRNPDTWEQAQQLMKDLQSAGSEEEE